MKDRFKTIHQFGSNEIIIKKSKFIGYARPINRENEAIEFIEEIKTKHRDATHNVPVYVFGENNRIQRYSDDGEPAGSAGIPILETIKKEDLKNVVIVVTRYFGGIKLGVGGLVRSYIKAAKGALYKAKIVDKVLFQRVKVRIDYTLLGKTENDLLKNGYHIEDTIYDESVNLVILCTKDKLQDLNNLLINLTNGKAIIKNINQEYFSADKDEIIL